jgi:histidinol-phosphate phosphatase family protein
LEKRKAVFFDRDGVINDLVERADGNFTSPWTADEFRCKPYVKDAIDIVKKLGFMVFVVTNQPGVHDGVMDRSELEKINTMLKRWFSVDEIICAVDKTSNFYKPGNGMMEFLIKSYNIDRDGSYMIGDRWKDIVPGHKSKLTTIFVGTEYIYPFEYKNILPDYTATDILDACTIIMEIKDAGI